MKATLSNSTDPGTRWNHAQEDLAKASMQRGIALLNSSAPGDLKQAIALFDRAIVIRLTLPRDLSPWIPYNLAGGWINRADALTRLGSVSDLQGAQRSYDAALKLLSDVPLELDPKVPRRMAIALLNRGLCLHVQRTDQTRTKAIRCFDECARVLDLPAAAGVPDRVSLLAAAWINRGNVLLDEPVCAARHARAAARRAIELLSAETPAKREPCRLKPELQTDRLKPGLQTNIELALKARHVLCRAIARLLVKNEPGPSGADLVTEATDAVESGLQLASGCADSATLRQLKNDLYRFGARVYQSYQPHFLTEFLLEFLEENREQPDERRLTALANIWAAFRSLQTEGFSSGSGLESTLAQIRELRNVEERLSRADSSV